MCGMLFNNVGSAMPSYRTFVEEVDKASSSFDDLTVQHVPLVHLPPLHLREEEKEERAYNRANFCPSFATPAWHTAFVVFAKIGFVDIL